MQQGQNLSGLSLQLLDTGNTVLHFFCALYTYIYNTVLFPFVQANVE